MNEKTANLDACVLYPAPLRDFFMHLALLDTFRARWTDEIHNEWIRNVLESRPDLRREQLERTRELMNAHVRNCLIENYEDLMDSLGLPDADDRHVLAAAIRAKAELIVTFNLKDFPEKSLEPYNVAAVHPDIFVVSLIETNPEGVHLAAARQWQSLKNPPKSLDEFLKTLGNNGLKETVERLRIFFDNEN